MSLITFSWRKVSYLMTNSHLLILRLSLGPTLISHYFHLWFRQRPRLLTTLIVNSEANDLQVELDIIARTNPEMLVYWLSISAERVKCKLEFVNLDVFISTLFSTRILTYSVKDMYRRGTCWVLIFSFKPKTLSIMALNI